MKLSFLLLVAFLMCSSISFGNVPRIKIERTVSFQSTELDSSLAKNTAQFQFKSKSLPSNVNMITYRIDGNWYSQELGKDRLLTIDTEPGDHKFEFYVNGSIRKIVSRTLTIKDQFKSLYNLNFSIINSTEENVKEVCKPVIYLYPQEKMEVEVKVDIKGGNEFLYPTYTEGWQCTASPNGDLTIGDEVYNYLFWESTQADHLKYANQTEGFIIEGENAAAFLEDKLTQAGFTSKEKADFITFWGPLIQKNALNFVRFEFNEVCDKFAELDILPKPDHIFRMYIFYSPIGEVFDIEEQKIERINRDGFTVLEWGGQKSDPIETNEIN